jgi:hypothetical protein
MKAYLIDPQAQTIEQVDYSGDYTQIYDLINASLFTAATFNEAGDTCFVDDEGLFNGDNEFFIIADYPQPLAGRALVLGCNDEGESIEPSISLEQCRALVAWVPRFMVGAIAEKMEEEYRSR